MNGHPALPSVAASPTVSVIVPCYNGAAFLREALDSALGQTHPPLEIIVIDDGSRDSSAAIAESYGAPVRVIRQPNQGESVARNKGLDEAQGDWVAFLDADDIWRPAKLASQLACVTPQTVAVHTNYSFFGDRVESVNLAECPRAARYDLVRVCLLQNRHFNVSSLLVRRELAVRFPTWTKYGEDLIYFSELLLLEPNGIELIEQDLVDTRRHARSQSANPNVQLNWHKTIEQWTQEQAGRMTAGTPEKIQQGLIERLVRETNHCYWRRDWDNYWTFRNYLKRYSPQPAVQSVLSQRVYPAWVYCCKDWLDRRRGLRVGTSEPS